LGDDEFKTQKELIEVLSNPEMFDGIRNMVLAECLKDLKHTISSEERGKKKEKEK
jgi:hypothetical protein